MSDKNIECLGVRRENYHIRAISSLVKPESSINILNPTLEWSKMAAIVINSIITSVISFSYTTYFSLREGIELFNSKV